jgi:twitching motility protein PilT
MLELKTGIRELLGIARAKKASDLHLVVNNPPVLRIDGKLFPLGEYPELTGEDTQAIFQLITTEDQQQLFKVNRELDYSLEIPEISRVRVNVSLQRDSISFVFRLIPLKVPTFEELGLPDICKGLATLSKGLVLITLAAMLNYLNQRVGKKIVTIEDPIEYVFPRGKCLISQRQLGNDTNSFHDAIKHALRQDPNVIMIGEMRDLETVSNALTAAETGHLVLSTIHTRGAAASISRIIVYPSPQQLTVRLQVANVLQGVISQTLQHRADGKGRVAAFEVMVATNAIRTLIREDKVAQIQGYIDSGQNEGMISMKKSLGKLVLAGVITEEEAMLVAPTVKEAEVRSRDPFAFTDTARGNYPSITGGVIQQGV